MSQSYDLSLESLRQQFMLLAAERAADIARYIRSAPEHRDLFQGYVSAVDAAYPLDILLESGAGLTEEAYTIPTTALKAYHKLRDMEEAEQRLIQHYLYIQGCADHNFIILESGKLLGTKDTG